VTAKPPFTRVLVANRGEIAVRIIRAAHELGMSAVAVYSDADAGAPHVRAADEAVRIGPATPSESYLSIDRVVAAARSSAAQAIHPGYGFLSEQPGLALACRDAGIAFVGPRPETLAGLGDKLAARRAASKAGVPVVPGTLEPAPVDRADDLGRVLAAADEVGWPLLVKAAAGGGGRGMRQVDRPRELPEALAAASREAEAAFGDGSVYLERLIVGARHVEVQLLGDEQGKIVALGERDCSIQRRHQKLVEEAPAPGLDEPARRRLHAQAVAVAQVVGLENAATAEFLLDPSGSVWFLEVNARLQVEHGVTELVTGLDLVQEQFRIAAGEPLTAAVRAAAEAAATPARHAIEVRISAEDPGRGFAPQPGTVTTWVEPAGPGIRVDAGVTAGSRVPPEYDPLLAKLLVVGDDREAALGRLGVALAATRIGGIQTTLPFHRWVASEPHFTRGELSTDFVERHWHPDGLRAAAAERAATLAAAASEAMAATSQASTADGAPRDGWAATAVREATDRSVLDGNWSAAARREATERWPV
jgi:acetyl-CoA/propionyl-CoA carboxylase biotin carboxyl carrier protein